MTNRILHNAWGCKIYLLQDRIYHWCSSNLLYWKGIYSRYNFQYDYWKPTRPHLLRMCFRQVLFVHYVLCRLSARFGGSVCPLVGIAYLDSFAEDEHPHDQRTAFPTLLNCGPPLRPWTFALFRDATVRIVMCSILVGIKHNLFCGWAVLLQSWSCAMVGRWWHSSWSACLRIAETLCIYL